MTSEYNNDNRSEPSATVNAKATPYFLKNISTVLLVDLLKIILTSKMSDATCKTIMPIARSLFMIGTYSNIRLFRESKAYLLS